MARTFVRLRSGSTGSGYRPSMESAPLSGVVTIRIKRWAVKRRFDLETVTSAQALVVGLVLVGSVATPQEGS